ncbi:MAG: hypothetical protein CEE43_00015 [Promethearchaeota archaeon Loki_b32]|nr:MAG: hypothetical protein CEE43_00015 [Candidatus Lokiarchaeota archaeon Loki_b32]
MSLNYEKSLKNSEVNFKMFIDFDPTSKVFYLNYFFDEYKSVLKIALTSSLYDNDNFWDNTANNGDCLDLIYEKFDLTKYVYLLHLL